MTTKIFTSRGKPTAQVKALCEQVIDASILAVERGETSLRLRSSDLDAPQDVLRFFGIHFRTGEDDLGRYLELDGIMALSLVRLVMKL